MLEVGLQLLCRIMIPRHEKFWNRFVGTAVLPLGKWEPGKSIDKWMAWMALTFDVMKLYSKVFYE